MNWLSKKAVPDLPDANGNTAGYLFFETSEGFKFKSIDSMLHKKRKNLLSLTKLQIREVLIFPQDMI
jgi:hypothetical protein